VVDHPKAARVRRLFSAIAGRYDTFNLIMTAGTLRCWQRAFLEAGNFAAGERVLDVCCGTAELTIRIASRVAPDGRVVGLDFTEEMLAIGRRKVAVAPHGALIELAMGDAMDLPFPDGTFDAATIGFALRNVADIPRVLAEMTRVVRPGGRVISLELSKPENPLIGAPYYFYFHRLVPLLDRIGPLLDRGGPPPRDRLAPPPRNREAAAYTYLPNSLRDFPDRRNLARLFAEAGLVTVKTRPLTGGIVCLHWGVRPPA
jgi:demethylmenaquinone methyltransferase/2-methoxy-6-polyprenyl-1,4-benzoquinol methylase